MPLPGPANNTEEGNKAHEKSKMTLYLQGVSGLSNTEVRQAIAVKMLVGKSPAMETRSKVTIREGTVNVTEPLGWYKKDILQSVLNPEICLAST